MNISKIKPFHDQWLQVIIETPKSSPYKYDYDESLDLFCLNKIMPLGMSFPFDFGFIPGTKGADGDPLDVLVLMEMPAVQGVLIQCRVVGVLEANQKERDGSTGRNDRILAVSNLSPQYKHVGQVENLNPDILVEIESFFKQYNLLAGKEFISLGWKSSSEALSLIKSQFI